MKPWRTLDPWQTEVIEEQGNIVVRSGRQSGKSTAIAIKVGDYALKNPNKTVLVIASVERQAYQLFLKILEYIDAKYPRRTKGRVTMTFAEFKNGSKIRCLPSGMDGRGIRGYTIDMLVADEAAFIPEAVFSAITPMIAITKGKIILLSTPFGREGFFYKCFRDKSFKKFHISSEDCPRKNDEFLAQEKARMTKLQYAQEYLGEFIDELRQLFPDELIRKCMSLERDPYTPTISNLFLGVDIARMGADESTFEIIKESKKNKLVHIENIITKKTRLTDTIDMILSLDKTYNFNKIYLDDGGMGAGVLDQLLREDQVKRKVAGINNASRSLDRDGARKKHLMKEDLYSNLVRLMENGEISLLTDDEIFLSLKSVQFEYENGKIKIWGGYTHIAEGLIRAAWAVKDKTLNIWADYC